MSLELNPKETTKKVFSSKGKFVPKPIVITEELSNKLYIQFVADLKAGYFDKFPEVEKVILNIKEKCLEIGIHLIEEYTLTDLEAVTLKANDYIRDKYFRLPLWYQGGVYSY